MKKIFFCIIILIILENNSLANVSKILKYRLNKINNLHANFTQEIIDKKGKLIQKGKGELWLKHPSKFNFNFFYPDKLSIISNGKTLWIYNKVFNQVIISWLKENIEKSPIFFIINHNNLNKILNFYKVTKKGNKFIFFALKNNFFDIKEFSITILKNGEITYFSVVDCNYISIYNLNSKVLKFIKDEKFNFLIKKNLVVDDQRI